MNNDIRKYFITTEKVIEKQIFKNLELETKSKTKTKTKEWKVFTDGSAINNGKKNARGGIGIFFSDDNTNNIGEEFSIEGKTSNNICELEAVRRAIEIISEDKEFKDTDLILVCTDSSYVIDCITKWSNTWEKNGWKRKNKSGKMEKVKNLDLIKSIKSMYYKYNIQFKHIKAHRVLGSDISKDSLEYTEWYGNKMADEYANIGSN